MKTRMIKRAMEQGSGGALWAMDWRLRIAIPQVLRAHLAMLAVVFFGSTLFLRAAETPTEQQLITVLQSNASPQQKDAACARLKVIGGASSVPALAALLTDEQLSHSARYALESMPAPEAGRALLEALGRTAGLTRVGLINSLGVRGENQALPTLEKLLLDAHPATAAAAASALGKLSAPGASAALEQALPRASGRVRDVFLDALLDCANRKLAAGEKDAAAAIFQQVLKPSTKEVFRVAAHRGVIRSAGPRALSLAVAAIRGPDGPSQCAALGLVPELEDPGATKTLSALLPSLSPAVQGALIDVLAQRGDAEAAPAILPLASSADASVRLAAIRALGQLGDASAVPVLAAAATNPAEQKAARLALVCLRRGNVTDALLAQLTSTTGPTQVEVVRALGGRADASAVPRLIELAQTDSESAQLAALRALGGLADAPHVPALVRLVLEAKSPAFRTGAQEALDSACQRIQARRGRLDVGPIVQGMRTGSLEASLALLPVCSGLVDPAIRETWNATLADPNPVIREAGIRALCETRDTEMLSHLLAVAQKNQDASLRALAARGYVRLATQEDGAKLSNRQRVEALKAILPASPRPEEKRLVLAGLANVPDPAALQLVLPMLEDAAVRAEAAQAATRLATALAGAHGEAASAALRRVRTANVDASSRQAAEAALKQIEAMADFITAWQVAGPYRREGKNFDALFDVVFPPETAQAAGVTWRLLPAGADPQRPWLMDLLKALGGEQCVAYVRTRIYSPKDQPARLEMGTDDGVKAWLNGTLVHSHNVARPIVVGSDKANVTLKAGWNVLVLKITQNNLGWEFCARFMGPDGFRLEGTRFDIEFGPGS